MIESGELPYLVGATKEKDGEALGGYTCVKEENRYALCGWQKNCNRDVLWGLTWLKEENLYALGGQTKKMVIVMPCVGSRDWKRRIVMTWVGNERK